MIIVEIEQLQNGAHRNQELRGTVVPEGYAALTFDAENFPFGNLEAEEVDGVMTVTSWTPLPMPEPEIINEPTLEDLINQILGV